MNGTLAAQTSGIHWNDPVTARAYWRQEAHEPTAPQEQPSIFVELEHQMAQFEAEHQAIIARVAQDYVMPKDSSVTNFLKTHRTIPELLLEAVSHLKKHFGVNSVFALKCPVDEAGSQMLYGVVMWAEKIEAARLALNSFDDNWWIAHSRQSAGYVVFTYELV